MTTGYIDDTFSGGHDGNNFIFCVVPTKPSNIANSQGAQPSSVVNSFQKLQNESSNAANSSHLTFVEDSFVTATSPSAVSMAKVCLLELRIFVDVGASLSAHLAFEKAAATFNRLDARNLYLMKVFLCIFCIILKFCLSLFLDLYTVKSLCKLFYS